MNLIKMKKSLEEEYGRFYDKWNGFYDDDRTLFCMIYEKLMDAINEMEKVENPFIRAAFYNAYRKERQFLYYIITGIPGYSELDF